MKRIFHLFLLTLLTICFITNISAKDKWRTNIYQSSISNIKLDVKAGTQEEINERVQRVLKGKEKWCDAFIKQCPGKLKGVFTFKGKKRVAGIGYDVSAVKARKKANQNNMEALENSGLNKLGAYSTVLKVQTKNGYFVFSILRSPVSNGFRFEDFEDKSDDIIEDIDEE